MDRAEVAIECCRDDRPGDHARRGDTHDDLRVERASDLERERARQLSKQRPLDIEPSFRRIDFVLAW